MTETVDPRVARRFRDYRSLGQELCSFAKEEAQARALKRTTLMPSKNCSYHLAWVLADILSWRQSVREPLIVPEGYIISLGQ